MKISIVQMCSSTDFEANAEDLVRAIEGAGQAGSTMLFAPEMSACVDQNETRLKSVATTQEDSPFLLAIREAAKASSLWVHLGSIQLWESEARDKLVNRSLVIDSNGDIRSWYDKIHLFDVNLSTGEGWRESDVYSAGEDPVVVDTPVGKMGLAICYDLRFPELFHKEVQSGATILTAPAAFTRTTGEAHWHILLRARAIENGSYIIAAAQCGHHQDGRDTFGHSLVVDPWGRVLLDMGTQIGRADLEIDLSEVGKARNQIPVVENYKKLTAATIR
jgi:predicted amidohydrolase